MFAFARNGVLIGHAELQPADPSMGVATGRFLPTEAFAAVKGAMAPVRNGDGADDPDIRSLRDLQATTADGVEIVCHQVTIFEIHVADALVWEVHCDGITKPAYDVLFPR